MIFYLVALRLIVRGLIVTMSINSCFTGMYLLTNSVPFCVHNISAKLIMQLFHVRRIKIIMSIGISNLL